MSNTSHFGNLKRTFKTETGLDFDPTTVEIYIAYFHAKMTEQIARELGKMNGKTEKDYV